MRYRITGGTPTQLHATTPTQPKQVPTALVLAVALLLLGLGVGMVFAFGKAEPKGPRIELPELGEVVVATPPSVVGAPQDPAREPPVQASFELDHRRPSTGATFYAVGWVTHDAPYTIDKPKVTAVLLDGAGKEVGTAFGFAADVVAAGQRAPAQVLVMDPPEHARVVFEVVARKASYIPPQVGGLRLEHGEVGPDSFGHGYRVQGKVHNDGDTPARFVNVRVHAYDAAGELLGVDDTYADAEVLESGKSARFEVRMLPYEDKPTKFELFVTGQPAP